MTYSHINRFTKGPPSPWGKGLCCISILKSGHEERHIILNRPYLFCTCNYQDWTREYPHGHSFFFVCVYVLPVSLCSA